MRFDKGFLSYVFDFFGELFLFKNATQAIQRLTPVGDEVYFNTTRYFCCLNQYRIIFQTRAIAFSDDQAPLFKRFVLETKSDTLVKE